MTEMSASNISPEPGVPGPSSPDDIQQDSRDIARFLAGDRDSFGRLMRRYQQRAYSIALGLTGNHDDAMDAVQKAFIRIYRALPRFRQGEPFFPWLYRIVRNAALNQRRDEQRHRGDLPLEWVRQSDGKPTPLAETMAVDLRERLWAGIESLSVEQREVFPSIIFRG
ncbi:MAG: sigma-70 family RNA polymerase sigma factor [bacterium]